MQLFNTILIVSTLLFSISTSWASDRDMIIRVQPVSEDDPMLIEPPSTLADEPRLENTSLPVINSSRTLAEQPEPVSQNDPMLIDPPYTPAD